MVRKYSDEDLAVETGACPVSLNSTRSSHQETRLAASLREIEYYFVLDAIFLTIASTSFRSLSFRLAEYRRIWLRKRTSSSES
jgi:hypothetical protein